MSIAYKYFVTADFVGSTESSTVENAKWELKVRSGRVWPKYIGVLRANDSVTPWPRDCSSTRFVSDFKRYCCQGGLTNAPCFEAIHHT
jgi:hypothetical protein